MHSPKHDKLRAKIMEKRGDKMIQLHINKELKFAFKAALAANGITVREWVTAAILRYLASDATKKTKRNQEVNKQ